MVKILLNRDFVITHMRATFPVKYRFKDKYLRQKYKYQECLLLTQNGDTLYYTTCGPAYALQSSEKVDFQIPYPIALNLANAPFDERSKQVVLEIPDCTLENLRTFYDANRPKFIRDSDLQTAIVAINDRRANIEYIKPANLVERFKILVDNAKNNPVTNWQKYEWISRDNNNEIVSQNLENIYKTMFHKDDDTSQRLLDKPSESQILKHFEKIQLAAQYFGTTKKEVFNPDIGDEEIYIQPYALFQDAKQSIIWSGIAEKQK